MGAEPAQAHPRCRSTENAILARLTLILGGARSGKSRLAESLIGAAPPPWTYVATAEALDAEMRTRIAAHQARRGANWRTVEAPIRLADTIAEAGATPVLIDCLTLWLSNLILGDHDVEDHTQRLCQVLEARPAPTVLVSNEVGLGIVPDNALARRFRDAAGRLNQTIAARADRVLFMAAGLPITVK